MKLLHVTSTMNPAAGGVCQAVCTIISGLNDLGVHNEVTCMDDPAAQSHNHSLTIHALGPAKSPWLYGACLAPWLLKNLSRFDAVVVHGLWHYHSFATTKTIKRLRINPKRNAETATPKVFVMPHGMLDPYFQRAPDRKLKALRNELYWRLIEAPVINTADGLLFTCETERRLAAEPFSSYAPKRENVVGLGVEDPPAYHASMKASFLQKCPQAEGQSYLLFLGRIDKKKGVDLLLNAYANAYPQTNAPKLVVAGPGLETDYGQQMQELVSALGLQSFVFFPGMLTSDAKWGAFYGCEAFVLPSHQENFGIAVVEALACGKPVLISDQVNIGTEIKSAGGGLVCADTPAGVQDMLNDWRQLTDTNKKLFGAESRKTFERHFAVASASNHLLKAIGF